VREVASLAAVALLAMRATPLPVTKEAKTSALIGKASTLMPKNKNFKRNNMKFKINTVALAFAMCTSTATIAEGIEREEYQALVDRLIALEGENQKLRRIENTTASVSPVDESAKSHEHESLVGANAEYNYKVLDHAENTNTKQLYQLQALRDGKIKNKLTLGGQVTAIVNIQKANEDSKFGWLMRHPTSSNQIGKDASEAVVHSVNFNMTAKLSDDFTAYMEML
jgi:hypothetical protein